MRIIKTADQAAAERRAAEHAKANCNVCPFCGEYMSTAEAINKGFGLSKGISSFSYRTFIKVGLFRREFKTVDRYGCSTCGAAWESDPY